MTRGRLAAACVLAACVVAGAGIGVGYRAMRSEPGSSGPAPAAAAAVTATPPPTRFRVPRGALVVAPKGNDSAPGTVDRPLRTIAAAVRKAQPGSTIVLRAGTYREQLGVLHARLTLQPYPGEQVWVKGSLVVSTWRRAGNAWRHDGWSPNLCRNCFLPSIISPAARLAGQPDMVFVDGTPLRQVARQRDLRAGTFRVDPAARVLWLGANPAGRTVEATAFDRFVQFGAGAEGSVLQGIGVAQYGSNQDYGRRGAMVVVNASRVRLRDAVFVSSASSGVAVFQPDVVVEHSVFAHNGLAGLVGNKAHRLRLVGNTVVGNNVERFALTGDAVGAAGVKLAHTQQPYVADNVFQDNYGNGWWCDLGCSDAVVVRNVAQGNAVNGLYYEVSSRALIASNVLRDNAKRGLKISDSDRVRIWFNTFLGNGIALGIYGDPRTASFDRYAAERGQPWRPVELEMVGNLFASGDDSDQPYVVTEDQRPFRTSADQMLARADGNVYVRGPDQRPQVLLSWWGSAGRVSDLRTVTDITMVTGRERHGAEVAATVDELFPELARNDYSLRPGSAGEGAGAQPPADVAAAVGVPASSARVVGILAGPRR